MDHKNSFKIYFNKYTAKRTGYTAPQFNQPDYATNFISMGKPARNNIL